MNIFFFIYKEPDLYCYLPIGLELKKINKNLNISLVFCNKSNYTKIIEDDFTKKILLKNFNIIIFNANKNYLIHKYFNLINIIKILKKIIFKKNISCFFPKIIILNKKLLFILKKLKVKIVYISTERHIFTTSIFSNYRWKKTLLRFGQKEIEKFHCLFFFHRENFYYKYINELSNINIKKIFFIGLPYRYPAWCNIVKKEANQIKLKLRKKFYDYTSIYTIIASKEFDKTVLEKKTSLFNSLYNIVQDLLNLEPKCIIFFKLHPKDENPPYLRKFLKKNKSNRFVLTKYNYDVLSQISKNFFFLSGTSLRTDVMDVKKIDCSEIPKKKLYKYKKNMNGYNIKHIILRNKSIHSSRYKLNHIYLKKDFNTKKTDELLRKNPYNIKSILRKILH